MKSFRNYIIESSDKNTHLEHLEDEIFNLGVEGARKSILFLLSLRQMLSGTSKSSVNVSVKWDGAPAIVCGINPENKKFFVATKSAFNKTPKLNYTHKDIEENHSGKTALIEKLKIALDNLSGLGINGILQGDLLFTKNDLKTTTYNDEELLTFTPNTITYAVPLDSSLAKNIRAANIGIVFHTTYSGNTIESLKASFGVNLSGLKNSSKVWATDASFRDTLGSSTLTKSENAYISTRLSEIGTILCKLNSNIVNQIISNSELKMLIKTYINSKVKQGASIAGTEKYAEDMIQFITNKYRIEIDKLKTEKGKTNKEEKLNQVLSLIDINRDQFILMFFLVELMVNIKGIFLAKLKTVKSIGTFLDTPDGFKVTAPEGFVAVDHMGNAVKLVDRLEFSKANFNLEKNW